MKIRPPHPPSVVLPFAPQWRAIDFAVALIFGLVVATVSVAAQWPSPAIDDLMFTGAAFSIAKGHGLLNPWLSAQFGTNEFLVYPSFYFYLLGGWLKIIGQGTNALLWFQNINYLVGGAALSGLLSRRGLLPRPYGIWPAIFASGLLLTLGRMGMRPEACGLAAMLTGLLVLDHARSYFRLVGWLLVGGSLAISPHTLTYACAGVVLIVVWPGEDGGTPLWRDWHWPVGAAIALFLLLEWSVGGRVPELLENIHQHSSRTSLPWQKAIKLSWERFWGEKLFAPIPAVGLAAGILMSAALARSKYNEHLGSKRWLGIGLFLAALFATTISMIMDVARKEIWHATACLLALVAGAGLCARGHRMTGIATITVLVTAALWDNRMRLVSFWAPDEPTVARCEAVRGLVANAPQRRYLIDAWAARYVFDYHLPPDGVDWSFGRQFPEMWPLSIGDLKPNETWIITGRSLWMIAPEQASELRPALKLGGRALKYRQGEYDIIILSGVEHSPDTY